MEIDSSNINQARNGGGKNGCRNDRRSQIVISGELKKMGLPKQ